MAGLTFESVGSGIPVVCIHGFPLSPAIFENQKVLADGFKLIFPVLPGMGGSPWQKFTIDSLADSLAEMLTANDISKVILFGHSMGGYIALAFASRYASMLNGFGLIASHPYADSSEGRSGRLQMIERIHQEGPAFVSDVMIQKIFAAQTIRNNPELVAGTRSIMASASADAIINSQEAMSARPDRSFVLIKLKVPVGLFYGAHDSSITETMQKEIASLNPNTKLSVLPDSGHMPMLEQPDEFNEVFRDFLSRFK